MPYAKSFNKKTGTACVYEILENKRDPDKGCPVSKRKLIGTIDPETGKIVPARKRGSKDKQYNVPSDLTAPGVCSEPSDNQQPRKLLADELAWLKKSAADINSRIKQIEDITNSLS